MASIPFTNAEWLEKLLRASENSPNLKVKEVYVDTGCSFGDNFASDLTAIDVVATVDSKSKQFHLMAKCLPKNPLFRQMLAGTQSFLKEACAYSNIIPELLEFYDRHGVSRRVLELAFPKCYYVPSNSDDDVIVMENLKKSGYSLVDKTVGCNFDHCKLVLQAVATFHSLSFAMKKRESVTLTEKFKCLEDYFFRTHFDMFAELCKIAVENLELLLKDIPGQEENAEKLASIANRDSFVRALEQKQPKEPMALIIHGDLWCNNVLFQHDEQGKPTSVMMLDLQRVEYSNPMVDLVFFFYCSTTPLLRQQHLTTLLEIYHCTFMYGLKAFDISLPEYTFEKMFDDFKSCLFYGLMMASCIVPNLILAKKEEMFGADSNGEELEKSLKSLLEDKKKTISESATNELKDRMSGMVDDMVKFGIL